MRLAVTNGGSLLDALSTEGTLIARAVMNQKRHKYKVHEKYGSTYKHYKTSMGTN